MQRVFYALDGSRETRWLLAAVLATVLLLIPPNGVLNDNEEHYFAIARHAVAPAEPAPQTSVMDGMPHAYFFSRLTGTLIGALGYEGAQVASRLVLAALYAFALTSLFAAAGIGVLAAAMVLLGFWLLDQQVIGGEFMLLGTEPKTLAYPFAILGLAWILRERLIGGFAWLAVAAYLHFVVGGVWAGLAVVALLMAGTPWRRVVRGAALFAVAILPLLLYLAVSGYGAITSRDPAVDPLSPSEIISHVRSPHHTTPFASLAIFVEWLPGIALLFAISALSVYAWRAESGRGRVLAALVLVTCGWLLLGLAATAADRDGLLGPLTVFRPSSLMLLLALLLAVVMFQRMTGEQGRPFRVGAAVMIGAVALPVAAVEALDPYLESIARERQQSALIEFARTSVAPDAVLLIEPPLERELLSFERRTGRTLLVLNKFVPSTGNGVLEWYRRKRFQDALFASGCGETRYRVTHLIARSDSANGLAGTCGEIVYRDERYAVVLTGAAGSEPLVGHTNDPTEKP